MNITNHFVAKTIVIGIVVLSLVGSAVYMAINGKEGWGWFLFVGLLVTICFPTWRGEEKEKEDEDEE